MVGAAGWFSCGDLRWVVLVHGVTAGWFAPRTAQAEFDTRHPVYTTSGTSALHFYVFFHDGPNCRTDVGPAGGTCERCNLFGGFPGEFEFRGLRAAPSDY